jgi:hypothetical protein
MAPKTRHDDERSNARDRVPITVGVLADGASKTTY